MAKVVFFDNVFDLNNNTYKELLTPKSVKDFLQEIDADKRNYDSMVEVYDPDTGETSYVPLEDDVTQNVVITTFANGKIVPIDYVMKQSDIIEIYATPASTQEDRRGWGIGLAATGAALLLIGSIVSLFPGAQPAGGVIMGVGALLGIVGTILYISNQDASSSSSSDSDADSIPSLSGSQNQNLTGNPFPVVVGKTYATPYIAGSPYVELEYSDEFDESWFGVKTKMYMLLCVGYAPLAIDKILLDQLIFSKNPNNILNGILTYKRGDNNEPLDDEGNPITFNGNTLSQEIESSWLTNKPRIEISQFGHNRTIYPHSVIQSSVDAVMLYCYDNEYSEVADESNLITWNGGKYPNGYRTTTIHFSESVPYKLVVGINAPGGLYREWTTSSGTTKVDKIPMNVVVQWRPHYKYIDKVTAETNSEGMGKEWLYEPTDYGTDYSARPEDYTTQRFKGWRNFKISKVVPKITYTSGTGKKYFVYAVNGVPCTQNGYYGYWVNTDGPTATGTFVPCEKKKTLQECYDQLYNYMKGLKGAGYAYEDPGSIIIGGITCKPSTTIRMGNYGGPGISTYWTISETPDEFASRYAQLCYDNQDTAWVDKYEDGYYTVDASANPISKREIEMNAGLSEGTSNDCNPMWSGVECFSFGKVSGGWKMYEGYDDPSLSSSNITATEPDDYKNEMQFEIEAELSQEDILDLIGYNPMTNRMGSQNTELSGYTDVDIDCIEVRVIRLTPCYIDGDYNSDSDDAIQYTYSDALKWTYLKSFKLDKNKLLDDVKYTAEGNKFPKINVDPNMFDVDTYTDEEGVTTDVVATMAAEGSVRWNQWNISDYYSNPLSDEDQKKVVTLGFEVYPDKLGNLTGNMDKINVVARAITPALKTEYIRYWYNDNGTYYWYDSYDTLLSITSQTDSEGNRYPVYDELIPKFTDTSIQWKEADSDHVFADDAAVVLDSDEDPNLYWCLKSNSWDAKFFPEKIEQAKQTEISVDYNGAVNYNSAGKPITTIVKNGNNWFDYIEPEMKRHVDSTGRWVLTDSMKETFTDQNAVAQVLGVLCGKSLGKDAYGYNSTGHDHFIRYWYVSEDAYYYYDIDDTEYNAAHNPVYSADDPKWIESNEEAFNEAEATEIGEGLYYCLREVVSNFNMLPLKEAYEYTDAIDIKNGLGPLSYKCNQYLTSQTKVQDVLTTILTAGRAFWFYDEAGRIEIRNDKPLNNPVLLITDENVLSNSNTRVFTRGLAGYHITFADEDNGNQNGEIYILRQGQTREKHTRDIKDLSLTGITNNKQAYSMGQYLFAQSLYQRETWTRKLNHIGNILTVGSLVEIQSATLLIGSDHSGRVLQLIQDDNYIYGFIADKTYEYLAEYNDDGSNKQGCRIMQSTKDNNNRVVTVRFANREQQENGIEVTYEGSTTVYQNYAAQTNLVLFEKRIVKSTGLIEEAEPEIGVSSITEFDLHPGDVVAFGYVGSETSLALVYQIAPDENGKFSISMYPYNKDIYSCGDKYPSYNANITKRPIVDRASISDYETAQQIKDATNETTATTTKAINDIVSGDSSEITNPDDIVSLSAIATKDGINLSCITSTKGLSNTITKYVWKIYNGTSWQTFNSSSASYTYTFDRSVDGYPEVNDLLNWRVKASVINSADLQSNETETTVNTDSYGTWQLASPKIESTVTDRVISLRIYQASAVESYGNIRYKIWVQRNGESAWHCPATTNVNIDPYEDANDASKGYGYYDPSGTYAISSGSFTQVMSLIEETDESGSTGLSNTAYKFKIQPYNEAGDGTAVITNNITALCSSLRDIVNANLTSKEEYVQHLSAIAADFGLMAAGGIGNFNQGNYWALSDLSRSEYPESLTQDIKKGSFRVGGTDEYIQVTPVTNSEGVVVSYKVSLKAGDIELDSSGISSSDTYIYSEDENEKNIRLHLTHNGVTLETTTNNWATYTTAGSLLLIQGSHNGTNYNQVFFTNGPISEVPYGFSNTDIDAYHFNNSVNDESGSDSHNLGLSSSNLTSQGYKSNNSGSYEGVINPGITEFAALNKSSLLGVNSNGSLVVDSTGTVRKNYSALISEMGLNSDPFIKE